MQRPGYNPTRRNRNIGTENAGYGQDNRLVIPKGAWTDHRRFYEKLIDPVQIHVKVRSIPLRVLVEPTLSGFTHACSVDDIVRLLELVPTQHLQDIKLIVLRQPKRKEQILSSVWGRMVYWSKVGNDYGPTIYLEAQNPSRPIKWSKSQPPDWAIELERLRKDGHSITIEKRHHLITSTLESIRNTQLYRTLPHEIGHYVDYLEKVEIPSQDRPSQWDALDTKYDQRPFQEKESFAHRYADEFKKRKTADGSLPFNRMIDEERMKRQGLDPAWFLRDVM